MNRDDIIRMAREVGIPESENEGVFIANSDDLGRLIAAEREACAKLCDEIYFASYPDAEEWERSEESEAIRARGQG